jgi:hypothetical protein
MTETLTGPSTRAQLFRPATAVAVSCLIYLAIAFLVGRFPVTDEVFFKSAGRQWAAGAGFGAPELRGALGDVQPPVTEVFFLHPPMYPFSFGVWTRIFGFGARQCILFDASVHVLLTALTFGLAWRTFSSLGRARGWLAACAAVAILPLGTAGRPDELATCFSLLAWFLLLAPNLRALHMVSAGVALGFSLGTSSGAAMSTGIVALTILLRAPRGLRGAVRRCVLFAAGTILGITIALGPLLAAHPNALNQYLTHARFLVKRVSILNAWAEARPHATKYYTFLIGTFVAGLLATALIGTRRAWRTWADYGLGASIYLFGLGAFLALRNTYTWFIGPWILLAAVHMTFLLATMPDKRKRAILPAALLVAGYASFAVYFVKETIVVATLPPAQRLDAAAARLRSEIPAGATVLTKDLWWFLGERNTTYEPMFSHPPESAIDYVALSANGSGVPGRAVPLDQNAWSASFTSRMMEVANDLPRQPTRVLGLRITNSAYGFGSVVYRLTPQTP